MFNKTMISFWKLIQDSQDKMLVKPLDFIGFLGELFIKWVGVIPKQNKSGADLFFF